MGDGVYEKDNFIYSSRVGSVLLDKSDTKMLPVINVSKKRSNVPLPQVNSVVIGKVRRVGNLSASLDIMIIDGEPVRSSYSGSIRKQDIRSFDRDTVDVFKCFMPGDIVRAEVISMGDSHNYYLSTAKNELGVVYAEHSDTNEPMKPISWEEMVCTKTGLKEYRKCAKPLNAQK
jgi:exosome complex component CSL4